MVKIFVDNPLVQAAIIRAACELAKSAHPVPDAKQVAGGQLVDIAQRKEAAADVPPVVDAIETYETILRDLRNLDERSAAEDIADIQSRIQKNGLIANMKAFQPSVTTVTPVSFDFR